MATTIDPARRAALNTMRLLALLDDARAAPTERRVVLGGGAGTTRDCLELIAQAEKYGARVALFGRKIYYAEDSVLMIRAMRRVIENGITSEEGVKAYHGDLDAAGIAPHRPLDDDLALTEEVLKANVV